MTEQVIETAGWDAITKAFDAVYAGQEPLHFGTLIKFSIGGPDPLDGVSIYRAEKQCPHWHYVSYGFSELYEKEGDDPDISGYGFELSFRLPIGTETEPPVWPISMMQNLARYVFQSGNIFLAGHHVDLNGPIFLDDPTQIKAILFTPDVDVPSITSPNGKLDVLQIVGITLDELDAAKQWNAASFTDILRRSNPNLITDLRHVSVMKSPEIQKEVDDGVAKDGSSMGYLMVENLDWKVSGIIGKSCKVSLGANAIEAICKTLPNRIAHNKPFFLQSRSKRISFEPTGPLSFDETEDNLIITMSTADSRQFATTIKPQAGEYALSKSLTIVVTKVDIKDAQGNVVETVG